MRQDDHQYNIELVPKWEVCKVQVAHMQVCAFLRLTIGRVVGRLFVQEVE
jgi:hypothetical protein